MYRAIYPRSADVINDILELGTSVSGDQTELFVLDFVDAFWQVPLRHCERRFFVGKLRGQYVVYLRTAQGSRAAPITWACLISLVARCTQALFSQDAVRLQVYVDDPTGALYGSQATRDRNLCIIVLLWMCLGFPHGLSQRLSVVSIRP